MNSVPPFNFSYQSFADRSSQWEKQPGNIDEKKFGFAREIIQYHGRKLNQIVDPVNEKTIFELAEKERNSFLMSALIFAQADLSRENYAGQSTRQSIDSTVSTQTTSEETIIASFFEATTNGDLAKIKELHQQNKKLIEKTAQNKFDQRGLTALQSACTAPTLNFELIQFLGDTCTVDVNRRSEKNTITCSHFIPNMLTNYENGKTVCDYLWSKGIDLNATIRLPSDKDPYFISDIISGTKSGKL